MLNWVQVRSSAISAVAYEDSDLTLYVEFTSGEIYKYDNVPRAIYNSLIQAASIGRYFIRYIRDVYACDKVR